jgi:hypothetical protein
MPFQRVGKQPGNTLACPIRQALVREEMAPGYAAFNGFQALTGLAEVSDRAAHAYAADAAVTGGLVLEPPHWRQEVLARR